MKNVRDDIFHAIMNDIKCKRYQMNAGSTWRKLIQLELIMDQEDLLLARLSRIPSICRNKINSNN